MIVLGRKYKFTEFEKSRLNKKFKNQFILKYSQRDPFEVLEELKCLLDKTKVKIIVLNTRYTVPNEVIKYLTNLQFERNIKLITIEQFMEEYLHKCYIPDDHTDLNYLQNIKPFNIFEYIKAAKIVKKDFPNVEFVVLGGLDEQNPGGLKKEELEKLLKDNIVLYPGFVKNVDEWIKDSSVFVLPSYREGVPRSTQEAMAIGRAVITTDVPGCRETVVDGLNGFLIPPFDSNALVETMKKFVENPHLVENMGEESYKIAKDKFDAKKVNDRLLRILEL